MRSRFRFFVPLLLAGMAGVGCGLSGTPVGFVEPAPVHGKVTMADGTPLKGGVIYFEPVEVKISSNVVRYQAASLVDANGNYRLGFNGDNTGAAPGDYKIVAQAREVNELPNSNSNLIPTKFQSVSSTPLTLTVREGDNTLNIQLK